MAFGYLVDRYGSYSVPFIPMAAFLALGAFLWLKVDPTETLIPVVSQSVEPLPV